MPFDPSRGGVQNSTYKLVEMFENAGHKAIVLSFTVGKSANIDGVEVRYVGEKIASSKLLVQIFNQFNPDVCINQMGYQIGLTKLLRRMGSSKMKLISHIHINPLNFVQNSSEFINSFLSNKHLSFIPVSLVSPLILGYHRIKQYCSYRITLHYVDALIFLSPSFIQELLFFGIDIHKYQGKIYGFPNPFQIDKPSPSFSRKENCILFVGRLNVLQKRTDLLMEIWNGLHDQLPDWKFWVVGDGPEMNNMKFFCEENYLDRVKFFGFDNPVPYYKKAKILHFTSAYEGFGNVLVEAQRDGVIPILFDSYSAAKDIVQHGRNGILIKPFDTEAFVNHTIRLTANQQVLSRLSIQAQNDVHQFSYKNIFKKWDKLFYEIGCSG